MIFCVPELVQTELVLAVIGGRVVVVVVGQTPTVNDFAILLNVLALSLTATQYVPAANPVYVLVKLTLVKSPSLAACSVEYVILLGVASYVPNPPVNDNIVI